MKIDVYSAPDCNACLATKRWLKREGLQHNVIDVSSDEDASRFCADLGYTMLPVVVAGDDHWSGFRYDKLTSLRGRR